MSGNKIEDDKQEYSLSQLGPSYISPAGHELSFYDTEENERLVVKHSSGSHIEFKADGSVFIKAIKNMELHSQSSGSSDVSTLKFDADLGLEVGGKLHIKCKQFDLEVDDVTYIKSGTDFKLESNNIIQKAGEQASIEATKSIYLDAKEKRERFTSTRQEIGTEETPGGVSGGGSFAPTGGVNVINVTGNTVIQNDNPSGGITISSAGYLNLVCGGERVDITGKWGKADAFLPSVLAKPFMGTHTTLVYDPAGKDTKMQYNAPPGTGGSYVVMSMNSGYYKHAVSQFNHPLSAGDGHRVEVIQGNKRENVLTGNRFRTVMQNENVQITGIQRIQAQMIFLN